jgi:hypothetical protein
MISVFLPKKIKYNGSQITSLWAYKNLGVLGDSIVSFIGPCNIPLKNILDVEDIRAKNKIFSSLMLHFIIEHFDCDLEKTILRQRLLTTIVRDVLTSSEFGVRTSEFKRIGNNLYCIKNNATTARAKLSISIATVSPVSSKIHFGINIETKRTPVKTAGLSEYKINPKEFALKVMQKYNEEMDSIKHARCKVRPGY